MFFRVYIDYITSLASNEHLRDLAPSMIDLIDSLHFNFLLWSSVLTTGHCSLDVFLTSVLLPHCNRLIWQHSDNPNHPHGNVRRRIKFYALISAIILSRVVTFCAGVANVLNCVCLAKCMESAGWRTFYVCLAVMHGLVWPSVGFTYLLIVGSMVRREMKQSRAVAGSEKRSSSVSLLGGNEKGTEKEVEKKGEMVVTEAESAALLRRGVAGRSRVRN